MERAKFLYFSQFFLIYLATSTVAEQKPVESKVYTNYMQVRFAYPYSVALFLEGNYRCGASNLNFRYVVSAAHCFFEKDEMNVYGLSRGRFSVIGGSSYIREIDATPPTEPFTKYGPSSHIQKRNVTQTFIHALFRYYHSRLDIYSYLRLGAADIGVALLETPFIYRFGGIQPIHFFSNVFWRSYIANLQMFHANRTCYGIGWGNFKSEQRGYKNEISKLSKALREVRLRVFDTEACVESECLMYLRRQCKGEKREEYKKAFIASVAETICTFPLKLNYQAMCKGDSGSPLVCDWEPTKQDSLERGYVVGHLVIAGQCGPFLHKWTSHYLPYVNFYGFLSVFDLSIAGSLDDPYGSSTACNPLWPASEECMKMKKKLEEEAKSGSGRLTAFATALVILSVVSSRCIFVGG